MSPLLRLCSVAMLSLACSQAWAASPAVTSVAVPANGSYGLSQHLDFTVNWDMPVAVTGTPQIAITLNTGGTVQASYIGGSGGTATVFRYTVMAGNSDPNGITVGSLTLNGGAIRDITDTDDATLMLNALASTASVLVDTTPPTLPAANIVVNNQTDPQRIVLTFSENLDAATLGSASQWGAISNNGAIAFTPAAVSLSAGKTVTLTLPPVEGGNLATMVTNALAVGHLKVTPPATLTDTAGNPYAAGLVTEAGASHILDTTPPTISALSLGSVTGGTATLQLTTSEKTRLFWIAVPAGSAAPSEAQVKAGAGYGAVTPLAQGIAGVASGAGASFGAAGLPSGVALDVYVAANDAAGNGAGSVLLASLSTPAPASSHAIPTLSFWGLAFLSALLGLTALRRRV